MTGLNTNGYIFGLITISPRAQLPETYVILGKMKFIKNK